jgi:hypothetical protein
MYTHLIDFFNFFLLIPYWNLFYDLEYELFWRILHVHKKKIYHEIIW